LWGNEKGLIGQIYKASEIAGSSKPMVLHHIIHQQALCGKSSVISCVMVPAVSVVKFIRSHGLNQRQFYTYLAEIEQEFSDLPYHTAVRWLSRGKAPLTFTELRQKLMFSCMKKPASYPTLKQRMVVEVGFYRWPN
jgi:hypothetical protein